MCIHIYIYIYTYIYIHVYIYIYIYILHRPLYMLALGVIEAMQSMFWVLVLTTAPRSAQVRAYDDRA